MYKSSFSRSQKTHSSPITKTSPLMLFREAIALLFRDKEGLLKNLPKVKCRDYNCKLQVQSLQTKCIWHY